MKTRQELFDTAVRGIRAQGALSNISHDAAQNGATGGRCRYEHNGLRCAVGHLVPEDVAKRWQHEYGGFAIGAVPTFSGEGAHGETEAQRLGFGARRAAIKADLLAAEIDVVQDMYFLQQMQELHDCACSLGDFENCARKFARKNSLTFPEPEA